MTVTSAVLGVGCHTHAHTATHTASSIIVRLLIKKYLLKQEYLTFAILYRFYVFSKVQSGLKQQRFKNLPQMPDNLPIFFKQISNISKISHIKTKNLGALQRNKNSKSPRLLWKWVGGSRSHSEFFFWGNSSQNSSKPELIFWSSIPCVFGLYVHCYKLLVTVFDLISGLCLCNFWQKKTP